MSGNRFCGWRLVWLFLFVLLLIDYKVLLTFAFPFYILMNVILAGLLIFGRRIANTRSWLVFGPFQFQPSELTKLAVILLLARLFSSYKEEKMSFRAFLLSSGLVGLPFILIALQPDLGTALTFVPVLLGAYILAGLPKKYVILILIVSLLAGLVGWNYGLKDYQKKRIETLLVPGQDPRGAGYQLQQSKIALGSGGLTGKGYHKGTQSQLRFLPARQNDFILAVVGEDLGFLGILVSFWPLFLSFFTGYLLATQASPDRAGVYIAFLAAMLIGCQFLINVMMIVGLFPITGIPIPFLSYGGSSLLSNFLIVGLVINVKMRRFAYVRF